VKRWMTSKSAWPSSGRPPLDRTEGKKEIMVEGGGSLIGLRIQDDKKRIQFGHEGIAQKGGRLNLKKGCEFLEQRNGTESTA